MKEEKTLRVRERERRRWSLPILGEDDAVKRDGQKEDEDEDGAVEHALAIAAY